jgi:hypothetical protein
MKMTTERLLLTDPSSSRNNTTCNQRVRIDNLTWIHYDVVLVYEAAFLVASV